LNSSVDHDVTIGTYYIIMYDNIEKKQLLSLPFVKVNHS